MKADMPDAPPMRTSRTLTGRCCELKQAGAETVYLEYEHGDAVIKEQLSLLLEQAQAGDTIITLEVSRLARSTKQLCEIIDAISKKHLVPCDRRQYYNGLPERARRPDDRSVFTDGRRVQPIRACDDTRKGALRNGKCQSQGQANRQTAPDNRPNPHHLPAPLSGV